MLTVNGIDITNAVTALEIRERLNGGAAALKFSVTASEAEKFESGDRVVFTKDGATFFSGRVFSKSISRDMAEISALDAIADLKSVMPVKRTRQTAYEFVKMLFAMVGAQVKTGAVDSCGVILGPEQYKGISVLNLLYHLIDEIEKSGGRFVLRDEAGVIVFRNESSLKCGYILERGYVVDMKYTNSVGDAINSVTLISNNEKRGTNEYAEVKDAAAIEKWGVRSYTKRVYEKVPEKLMASAKELLLEKCKVKETLEVTAVGDMRVRAGCLILCKVLGKELFWARTLSSEHRFDGKSHFMRLELECI